MGKKPAQSTGNIAFGLEDRALAFAAIANRPNLDPEIVNLSAAISLKRIADAMEASDQRAALREAANQEQAGHG